MFTAESEFPALTQALGDARYLQLDALDGYYTSAEVNDEIADALDFVALNYQDYDPTLTALASYNANGLIVQTAADTFAGRTIRGGQRL